MRENKEFVDGKLFVGMNYIYWILVSSGLFLLTNILFIFVLFVSISALEQNLLPIHIVFIALVISSILMGPSFSALYTVMRKVVRQTDVSVVSDFFKGYRKHFKQSFIAWIIILFFISLFAANYYIMVQSDKAGFLILPLFLLISFLICASFYIFPLIATYYLSLKDVFKLGFYFALKEFKTTFLILVGFVVAGYLFILFPSFLFIVLPGLLAFITMYLCAKPIQAVQANLKEVESSGAND